MAVKKLSKEDLIRLNKELHAIVKAGMPMDEGLRHLAKELDGQLKPMVEDLQRRIEKGESLSAALAARKDLLEDYYIAMVRAGEESGNLGKVLLNIIAGYQRSLAVERTIRTSCRYPVIILCLFLVIFSLILIKVLPQFAEIYAYMGAEIPGPAAFFITLSTLLRLHYLKILAVVIGVVVIVYLFGRTKPGRTFLDALLLRLPFIGSIAYFDLISTFARNLANLLTSNVPLDAALRLTRSTLRNSVGQMMVARIEEYVSKGKTIAAALEENRYCPPATIWMIKTAEERGDLENVLYDVAQYYDDRYYELREETFHYIEPFLIVLLGLVIGFMVISLYLPLFTIPKIIGRG
jgi:type IV pilus assembly protein PilC